MTYTYIIRKAIESDAEQILEHIKKVLRENSSFMATSLEEFTTTIDQQKEWINAQSTLGLLLVAEVNGIIIGMLNFRLSPRKKFSHQGMFGMSIQERFTSQGIGGALINELLNWAKEDKRVEKISLEVFSNNERAIHLYTKMGFREEGRRIKQAKLSPGEYVDDILMSIFV
ncbi:GNAT family N-acetyltransferase [Peribacillus kribbensis]|uniref:GNAT family N-acetyltransferase n=1 Tax=Peribacillus kribbensis TaxID=356658 RepID=UPI000400B959|nr:GNAT family N-acetyltransferase [Peribacillus kribbensis]